VESPNRPHVIAALVALVMLAGLAWLSIWAVQPPSPASVDAPADTFSATRAYADVRKIGSQVHVAGSTAEADVRDDIVATLTGYGLQVQVQDGVGLNDAPGDQLTMAHVHNVVAILSGTASTGRVFDVAHYDSVQVSYGANDDGAGVSSLLETARAMTHGARPRNDVVFVFTDAEEACLCGAEAFVSGDPLAASGGVALNFESRGSSGSAIMFETSQDNAGVVSVYANSVPYPVATSFAVEVYRRLPNDTDFTVFRESGRFTGLNSAYIDGSAVYHSPEDRPSYMDVGSLQQDGANALALTRAFGQADLTTLEKPAAHDATYFPVLRFLVRYPGWLVWPLAVCALLAVAALATVARRRAVTTYRRIAAGFGLGLIPLILAPVLAQALWALLVAIRPGYTNMTDPWQPDWYRAGVVALTATTVLTWYGLLRRRFGGWPLAIGALGWLAILGIVLAAFTPGGSYLATLPALAAALAAIASLCVRAGWAKALALGVGAGVGVLVLVPTVLLFFPALGLATGGAAALFAAMLGLALLPLFESFYPQAAVADIATSPLVGPNAADSPDISIQAGEPPVIVEGPVRAPGRRWRSTAPALVAALLTVAFVAVGLSVDTFGPRHPEPAQLMYALDTDTGQARWISTDTSPRGWLSTYVSAKATLGGEFPPLGDDPVETGPAQVANLAAPVVSVVSDTTVDGQRTLSLNVKPQRAVRLAYLRLDNARVRSATVDGRPLPAGDLTGAFGVLFHAPPAAGLVVTVVLADAGPVRVRVMDGSDGLTGLPGFIPRPPGVGVQGSHEAELVLVAKTYTI
jgi:hypothetical protein